jgi:hypothetical protein
MIAGVIAREAPAAEAAATTTGSLANRARLFRSDAGFRSRG